MKTLPALLVLTTLVAVGLLLVNSNATSPTPSQHFIGLGDLPGGDANSMAYGVSADGTAVVGCGNSAAGTEAFRWTRTRGIQGLGFPGAFAVSADGSMVVGYRQIAKQTEPVRWTHDGGIVCLVKLADGNHGSANAVSADGSVIVGTYGDDYHDTTFRWIAGCGIAALPSLPGAVVRCEAHAVSADGAVVVGESRCESGYNEAFRFHADTGLIQLGVLPGESNSVADGVSADGSVIVGSSGREDSQAFRWTQKTGMIGLGSLPGGGRSSRASGVSADGSIIVGQCYVKGGFEAFIWDAAHGMRCLREVLVSQFDLDANLAGWKLRSANAVSADGSFVVGCGVNPHGDREAWLAYLGDVGRPVAPSAAQPKIAGTRPHE